MRAIVLADLEGNGERTRAHVELTAIDDAHELEQHRKPGAHPHAVRLGDRRRPPGRRVVPAAAAPTSTADLTDRLLKHLIIKGIAESIAVNYTSWYTLLCTSKLD